MEFDLSSYCKEFDGFKHAQGHTHASIAEQAFRKALELVYQDFKKEVSADRYRADWFVVKLSEVVYKLAPITRI